MSIKFAKRLVDKTGQKFGRLTANNYNYDSRMWECSCDCGNHISVNAQNLSNGRTKSCGCAKEEFRRERLKQMWKDGTLKAKGSPYLLSLINQWENHNEYE
jgi:hypothetical protein